MFFVGVESFHKTSLLETAKVQNTTLDLPEAIRAIQSYGFVVVAGLIFGFDTDPDDVAALALNGILTSGLISGDPSLLTALPGTPLYERMKLSNRLRDAKLGLGGFKYQTNIRYLKPAEKIREDFKLFVRRFNEGGFQYGRLKAFYACLQSENYLPPETAGYANLGRLFSMVSKSPRHLRQLAVRLFTLARSPVRVAYILRSAWMTLRRTSAGKPLWFYFKIWLFTWSNSLVKYSRLSDADFDIESVDASFSVASVLPRAYEADGPGADPKVRSQKRITASVLRQWIDARG
jgi:hypothetical protein